MPRIPLLGGAYQARSVIAEAQRCVNLYPEKNPTDAPTQVTHYPTPGLRKLVGVAPPPPPPISLSFTIEPRQGACTTLNHVQVTASDPTFSGNITLALGVNPSGATLYGTVTEAASSGVADFFDLALDKGGVGFTLIASASGYPNAPSTAFTISAGQFAVCMGSDGLENDSPTNVPAGSHFGLLMIWAKSNGRFTPASGFLSGSVTGSSATNRIEYQGDDHLFLNDAAHAAILTVTNNVAPSPTDWFQDILSWDTLTQAFQWLRDGVDITSSQTVVWHSTNLVDYAACAHWFVNSQSGADLSDAYLWVPNSYTSAASVLNSLRTMAGHPIAIGSGAAIAGTAFIGLHGDAPSAYLANLGNGGAFPDFNPPLLPAQTTPWP